ncbi:MAG: 50S ribosomal protein L11 methyltransferase [Thermodesulfobacteriota bacterium]
MPARAEPWSRFSARVPAEIADALGARCIELGAPGVVVDERDLRRAPTDGSGPPARDAARFTAYFPPRLDPQRIEAELRATLDALAAEFPAARRRAIRLEPFRPPRYDRSWRRHFPPLRVGRRLLIAPSWSTKRELAALAAGRIVLRVDPAQAFGTGHHATTRGCLVAIERACAGEPPRRGLDVGSGTGILAVAMRALGVAQVLAVDTDPAARAATLACAAANGFPDVRVVASLAGARGRYDLVVANLYAGLLSELAPELAARVRAGGTLVVSGLLASQEAGVRQALGRAGFALVKRECRATWSTLTLVRDGAEPARPGPRRRGARRSRER